MKKIMAMLIIAITVCTFAFANGQQEADSQVTLSFLNFGDITTPEGQASLQLQEEFQAQNPDIKLVADIQFDESYHQKLAALLASGDTPDVFYSWGSGNRLQPVIDAGEAIDQKQFINPDNFAANAMIGSGPNGELYTVGIGVGIHSAFYANTTLLDELGLKPATTYEELVAQVPVIREAGFDVIAYAGGTDWVQGTCLYSTLLGRYGGPDFVADLYKKEASFTDEPSVQALEMIEKMYADGVFNQNTVLADYGTSLSQYLNSEAPYMLDGGWRGGGIEDPALAEATVWTVLPAMPGEKYAGSTNGGVTPGYAITKSATQDPAKFEAAKKLLDFMTGEHANKVRAEIQGVIPSYKVSGEVKFLAGTENQGVLANSVEIITNTLDNFVTGDPITVSNTAIMEIGLGNKTAAEAAAEIQAAYENN